MRRQGSCSGPIVVLDNGGGTIKLGWAGKEEPQRVFTNAVARVKGERKPTWGHDIEKLQDVSSLTLQHPIDRGYVVNWDLQRQIWEHAIRAELRKQPSDVCLLITEPISNFQACHEAALQVVFEDLSVRAAAFISGPELALRHHAASCPGSLASRAGAGVVVDAGFSFIHVVPFLDWQVLGDGVRRIDLGGKFMTNYLKELVSFRSLNMMDEAHLVEHIKEAACFVSSDLGCDLRTAKTSAKHKVEYVLPDGLSHSRSHLRPPQPKGQADKQEQVLVLNNERFLVPELAFHPSDVGLQQAGLAEAVAACVLSQHSDLQALLLSNVLVVGGLAACPGFVARLRDTIRPMLPDTMEVSVTSPEQPHLAAWRGGSLLAASPLFAQRAVSSAEYRGARQSSEPSG